MRMALAVFPTEKPRQGKQMPKLLILPVPGDTNDPECHLSRPSTALLPVTRTSVLHCAQQQVTVMEDHLILLTIRKVHK